ncbi:unnamed protein product, partial [Hapterophycus canaliculatus]
QNQVGTIIGKGGSTIKDLEDRTGCPIQISARTKMGTLSPAREVILTGGGDSPYYAKREIEAMLDNDERN